MACLRLRIYGRVQGVFYRNWTIEQARALGLAGWVRNRPDGSVEVLACGAGTEVERLLTFCRSGPPAAEVARIDVEDAPELDTCSFDKLPTL